MCFHIPFRIICKIWSMWELKITFQLIRERGKGGGGELERVLEREWEREFEREGE